MPSKDCTFHATYPWHNSSSTWMPHCLNHRSSSYKYWITLIFLCDQTWLGQYEAPLHLSESKIHTRSLLNLCKDPGSCCVYTLLMTMLFIQVCTILFVCLFGPKLYELNPA